MPRIVGRVVLHFHTAEVDAASHVDVLRLDVIESGLQQPILQRRDACREACVILREDKKVGVANNVARTLRDAAAGVAATRRIAALAIHFLNNVVRICKLRFRLHSRDGKGV